MNYEDDSFHSLLEIMHDAGATDVAPYFIGVVVAPNPLVIKIGDLQIERKNMKVNAHLLAGYTRIMGMGVTNATGSTASKNGGSGEDSFASHNHNMSSVGIPSGSFTTQDTLKVGDQVLMLKSKDGQQYIVICKLI